MYIFISHSAHDKVFVRRLADSLAFYGVPLFLDEREIKVGDNMPAKLYDALERATHVVYVLSKNSICSVWVKEELSVAKMRQLDKLGCRILPVLIDDTRPPSTVAHIKYADFRKWEAKESYLEALQELLNALEIKAHYATSAELRFFQQHLPHLMKITSVANTAIQLYFQMERLWFALFNLQPFEAAYWFFRSVSKTWDKEGFQESCRILREGRSGIGSEQDKLDKVLELCKEIEDDYSFWNNYTPRCKEDKEYFYQRIRRGEENSRNLSAFLYSIILELQVHMTI